MSRAAIMNERNAAAERAPRHVREPIPRKAGKKGKREKGKKEKREKGNLDTIIVRVLLRCRIALAFVQFSVRVLVHGVAVCDKALSIGAISRDRSIRTVRRDRADFLSRVSITLRRLTLGLARILCKTYRSTRWSSNYFESELLFISALLNS